MMEAEPVQPKEARMLPEINWTHCALCGKDSEEALMNPMSYVKDPGIGYSSLEQDLNDMKE
jgi:hypothetical protein